MELLLVLAVLIMVGALAAPNFAGWAESQRLRKSADIIRTSWARARIKAMKSGQTMVFRYEIGGNHYRIEAWQTPGEMAGFGLTPGLDQYAPPVLPDPGIEDTDPADDEAQASLGGGTGLSSSEQVLPHGITFVGSEIEVDARAMFMRDQMMEDTMPTSWSSPILFYPDGSASTTKLQLTDSSFSRFILVSLRGMTGIAQATDILSAAQVEP